MSRKKRKHAEQPSDAPDKTAPRGRRPPLLLIAAILTALAVGWGHWVWRQVEPRVLADRQYQLRPDGIELTPQPPWIPGDLKDDVLRSSGLSFPLSMLDGSLSERLGTALEFNPWIEHARVTLLYPGRAKVDVEYRKPVAVVHAARDARRESGLMSIDGRHLPLDRMSSLHEGRYPVVLAVSQLPVVGQKSEDSLLLGGLRLADVLTSDWHRYRLDRIESAPAPHGASSGRHNLYYVFTESGRRIVWGAAPETGPASEPSAEEKLRRLQQHDQRHPLGETDGPATIDLREPSPEARTARQP